MSLLSVFLLSLGFLFTFFIPGFLVVEVFLKKLTPAEKIPLYLLLSLLLSTYLVYLVSLLIGFSLFSILFSFSLFLPLARLVKKKNLQFLPFKQHRGALLVALIIFALFLIALYPAIFYPYQDYFVLSAVNWQDTAMHLGIIETISQGNFPPQAPYFSGQPLSYYFFTDFHTAILAKLAGSFFPQILVLDNPFFSALFFLSLYALAFGLTKNRRLALLAGFLGVFNGSFIFIRFFEDLFSLSPLTPLSVLRLLATRGYTIEFGQFFQIAPMADYFLQNRPMMVGLPLTTLVGWFIYAGFKKSQPEKLWLAGLLAGLAIKFQFFAYGVSFLLFLIALVIFLKKTKKPLRLAASFLLPFFAFSLFFLGFSVNNQSLVALVKENFSLGPWEKNKNLFWYLKFYFSNLGLSFFLSLLLFLSPRQLKKQFSAPLLKFLIAWFLVLFFLPNLATLTIFGQDMFKFFYFALIPLFVFGACLLTKIQKSRFGLSFTIFLLIISSLTSFLTLTWSFLNKNFAYSGDDLTAGLWIRNQTPSRSVFIALPTVHSPITQIGGRLRVLSYINWPHSHGFNRGEDNVFQRQKEIRVLYQGSDEEISTIMKRYQAQYVFYGPEEQSKFPEAGARWEKSQILEKVYDHGKIKIYQLRPSSP